VTQYERYGERGTHFRKERR